MLWRCVGPLGALVLRTILMRQWCTGLAATALAVAVSYFWLDRPIAFFANSHVADKSVFIWMQRLPEILPAVALIGFVCAGIGTLAGWGRSRWKGVMLLGGVSFASASLINQQLKFAFGRTWPETWVNNNPSLITNGAYGFNPFHGGAGFASFPSGHSVAICSVMAVLWFLYPKWRVIYVAPVAVIVIGLLGADFHFLSDIIAGGFVGWSVGWFAALIWQTSKGTR